MVDTTEFGRGCTQALPNLQDGAEGRYLQSRSMTPTTPPAMRMDMIAECRLEHAYL